LCVAGDFASLVNARSGAPYPPVAPIAISQAPHGATDEHVDLARRTGATDADIIEALAVMELFTRS
jgi:hypothetical protein